MLKPEQLERVVGACGKMHYDHQDNGWLDILRDMQATLTAMRTPITAEALVQAGWVATYESQTYSTFVHDEISSLIEVEIFPLVFCVNINDASMDEPRWMPNVHTMHDLAELVRLLGGEA